MIHQLRTFLSHAEDVVFPPICAGCNKRGSWFCERCHARVRSIPRPICHRCGQPTPEPVFTCAICENWPIQLGSMRAAFVFEGPIREQIHRFKYRGEFARASILGDLMFERVIDREFVDHSQWNLVAYVPLHRRRRRKRGFDQSELLSRRLGNRLKLPLTTGLVRVRDTPTQVGQGEVERRANMRNAFDWKDERLHGRKVLLIDDVVTTGSTLLAAAQPLIDAGVARVDGFALAREILD